LPYRLRYVEEFLYRYQFAIVLFLLIFAWRPFISIALPAFVNLFVGFSVF